MNYGSQTEAGHEPQPAARRSLQWLRRNVGQLRVIVSLQRVPPPDDADERPRKVSGK